MRTHRLPLLLAAALALAAAGCGGDDPVSPTSSVTQSTADDIALQVAQTLGAENGGIFNLFMTAAASVPSSVPASAFGPRGAFATASAAARETTFSVANVTYTLTYAFYDAQGNELPQHGPGAVRMVLTTRAAGSVTKLQYEASLGHAGVMEVTGIEPPADTLELGGSADDTLQARFTSLDGQRTRYFYAHDHLAYAAVRMLKDPDVNPWPLSGSATWAVHAERLRSTQRADVEARFDAVVVVTFNGTQYPEITVNGAYRYRLNLNTGAIARL